MSAVDHTTVREAREDSGLTQRALAEAVGLRQSNIAAIESGKRAVSDELLERILAAADYRPSLALSRNAEQIIQIGSDLGVRDIRVFGSVARGDDHHASDIDLLVSLQPGVAGFELGAFSSLVEELTGFPVDVVVDRDENTAVDHIRATARPLV